MVQEEVVEVLGTVDVHEVARTATKNAIARYKATYHPLEGEDDPQDFPPAKLQTAVSCEVVRILDNYYKQGDVLSPEQTKRFAMMELGREIDRDRDLRRAAREKKLKQERLSAVARFGQPIGGGLNILKNLCFCSITFLFFS